MARIVIEVKERTKAALDKAVLKDGRSMKEYMLWMLGLSITEKGNEKK